MTKLLMSWNEMRERARKIAHNSALKIEATKGREMNTSKSEKNSGTAHTRTRLGALKQNDVTEKRINKYEQEEKFKEFELQNIKVHDA